MEFLQNILENSQYGFFAPFIFMLMTAISPYPLTKNISSIGFISGDMEMHKRVFLSGIVNTLKRAIGSTAMVIVLFLGASQMKISMIFQGWSEKLFGPFLIFSGLFMLDILKLKFPGFSGLTEKNGNYSRKNDWSTQFLERVFTMTYYSCSEVLFFVMLIPIIIVSISGLYFLVVYVIGTGMLVFIFAWLVTYIIANKALLYNKINKLKLQLRRIISVLFLINWSLLYNQSISLKNF